MRKLLIAAAALGLALSPLTALSQESGADEIVVTGSRLSEYDGGRTPHVALKKRADNIIVTVKVTCDTRDAAQRKAELKATLQAMLKAAAAAGVEFATTEDEDIVGAFDPSKIDGLIRPDARPDTSYVSLTLKTKILPADTYDSATGRIESLVKKTPKTGRSEILLQGDWNLTLIGPQRYHPEVVALISEDSRKIAAAFGPDYAVNVDNLQLPLAWYQSGPLELAFYIPYKLTVVAR